MLKRNLIIVGFTIIFSFFAANTFGQSTTPVVRKPKTAKIKLPSPKGMNKSDLTEQLAVRANGQNAQSRKRKPKAENFAGTIMEGSNIHRKQPRRKNKGQTTGVRKPNP